MKNYSTPSTLSLRFQSREKRAFESPPPPPPPSLPPRDGEGERQGPILLISSVVMFLLNKTLILAGTRE